MEISRFYTLLCLLLCLLFWRTHQLLQPSQRQVLLQLRKQLEYPKPLDYWVTPGIDLCDVVSSPQVNITCQNGIVIEIRVFGDLQRKPAAAATFNGFPISYQTLSINFSMDSLIATLSRLNNLRALSLVSLGIWGPFPAKIHRFQSLEYLDLSWNFLYGSLPPTLVRIPQLHVLKVDGNFLNGTFPDWLDSFSNLTSLSLRNNLLTGPLPSSMQKIPTLTDINLSHNRISGKLPDLGSLRWVDLSNNSLSGEIPDKYGKLNQLQQIDLSSNALTGTPPSGLFSLPNVSSINLASNMLSGSLPLNLGCGPGLQLVDISNNRLRGDLPPCLKNSRSSRVVKFGGNCLLMDQQHPETFCLEEEEKKKNNNKSRGMSLGILIGVIAGIGVILLVLAWGLLVLCRQYCPRGTSEQHLLQKAVVDSSVTAEILTNARYISDAAKFGGSQGGPPHRPFSLDELKAATNSFDNSTMMGEGSTGKIYKGRLENGTLVAIRRLTVSRKYTIRNLKLRLDLLAKLRHPHLVCFLGHCIESEGKDESGANNVYLIYEFVSNGNYRAHLSETNPEKVLKWSDRLSILTGIAKAVHFLHTGVIPGFYSNRLKSNNILLNEHRMGKLSDYGLSVVAQEIDKHKEEGLKSWQMKSLEDDIYSFGVILLESLAGPSVRARTESFLLNEMVSLGNPDGQRRIVDPAVLASCSQESLSIVISLTINCISPESSTRPSFEDVLWNLQYAAQVQSTSHVDPRTGKTLQSP
ncbi:hypothetical protein ACS0TY_034785 [Phlomoides rotata]